MSPTHTVVKVPQLAWWEDIEAELPFPDGWEVTTCHMRGHDAPKLSPEGFRQAFANPIGTRPIRELARGKRNVVILFDDMSRPTQTAEIVPYLLEELRAGGVADDNIQFICALGCHGALTAHDFRKKLGEDVVANFHVYNHNPYENCTYIGKTSRGTPVSLNAEFLSADLKIGIGCLVPHPMSGFGGGGKIILPGVAAIETIAYNHGPVRMAAREARFQCNEGMGRNEDNAMLFDLEEVCRMSGLDVKIDAVVNLKRDTTALFVGEPIAQYYEGVKLAKEHYFSPMPDKSEVVVANCNAKVNEALIGVLVAQSLLPEEGGTLVMISHNPWGEVPHYLLRRFGDHIGGRMWKAAALPPRVKKFIFLAPYKDKTSVDWIVPLESVNWARTWDEVMAMLQADFPRGAKTAVIPDATIQFFEAPAGFA
ncbi:MAG TPA: DUF2088 domain-containing protein [Dehalococcoidia bacterium]|nr:DUF2088 domain-containing protein [Dehalococcoidia bacterium]